MEILKKKHHEILALCKLEKDIRDIYVEGNSDKAFLEIFLKNKKCVRKIVLVDIVDFSELPVEYFEGLNISSNRNKGLILSKFLNEKLPSTHVRCIVDKDFDDYIKSISNPKLFKTDFSCLESYLFCEEVIDKFLKIGVGNFPFDGKLILEQLSNVLKPLFCLRLLREIKFPSANLVDIDGNLSIDKKNGTINFDQLEYLNKFISKNAFVKDGKKIVDAYNKLYEKLNLEIRHQLNGHDFLKILFLYVNKIKNTHNYREDNFCKSLYLAVETPMIENYSLFKNIVA
ncbi:MAG: DUF4435 domain-containing protein [Bacteroidia bacterium]